MSTSYDKVVKLACKPKAAPPKPKYLDPIIAATWSEDGAVHDVCKALSPRFREPNVIVVFKALIVLHTMIRNGATDNVLAYLSSSDVLRLKNISAAAHWEGYNAPQNMQNYAIYLDSRIKAYRDLKHDAIRVQSESNRDMRNSAAIEEDRQAEHPEKKRFGRRRARDSDEGAHASSGPQRSKTIAGRKLRVMTVEKGLLRETKVVQKMIDALVECRFYLDNLEDELNITSLRMLVKDLLILFQACNEGVINVLEHYFEMSKIDAREALNIYRHFCSETERVVEFLGVAKKLQNLLNVPIPNLRHAPVSLAGALEEYLNDPNFEQNRIEYKTAKEIADKNARNGIKPSIKPADKPAERPATSGGSGASSPTPQPETKANGSQSMIDFFSTIESEQQTMFNPQTNSPTSNYFQQQAAYNPFQQQQGMQQQMMTGQPFAIPQMQQPVQGQPTGFMVPQATGMNPFNSQQPQQSFGNFLQAQPTGFLVPQATGANPFRQSMLMPQSTGMPGPFGFQQPQQPPPQQLQPFQTGATNPFPQSNSFGGQPQSTNPFPTSVQPQPTGMNPFPGLNQGQSSNPFPNFGQSLSLGNQPSAPQPNPGASSNPFPSSFSTNNQPSFASPSAQPASSSPAATLPRSASVPLGGNPQELTAVKTHQTGSRNPFGQPVAPPPPVPKVPTLMELAMGRTQGNPQTNGTSTPSTLQPQATGFNPGQSNSLISNIASSFATGNESTNSSNPTNAFSSFSTNTSSMSPTATGSTFSNSLFSSLASQPTGATTSSNATGALQPQTTGFSTLKPFKPSSSFGAALLESLPPIPQSAPTTPDLSQQAPKHNPTGSLGSSALLSTQPTGFASGLGSNSNSSVGVGLRPQATGLAGQANPFRATMFSLSPGPTGGAFGGLNSMPTGLPSQQTGIPGQFVPSGNSLFGSSFGAGAPGGQQQQQQQNGQPTSLI